MLSIYEPLERLGIVNPLKRAQSIGHRRYSEGLEIDLTVQASWVFFEYLVHDIEQLLHALVQSEVLTTFDQQVVIFLVAAMNSNTLWSLD